MVINNDLKLGDNGCGNCSTKHHTLSQQDCDSSDFDVSSGYGLNSNTLSQCQYSSVFRDMDGDAEKGDGDVSSTYVF